MRKWHTQHRFRNLVIQKILSEIGHWYFAATVAILLCFPSCSNLDDDVNALRNDVTDIQTEISSIKQALEALKAAYDDGKIIKQVTPLENEVGGWKVTFSDDSNIELYNGNNGTTPQLKVEDEYWYVSYDDGETWTKLDKAVGEDGITPQFKIEEDYWFVSYDNGGTWNQLDKAVGEDGQNGITPRLKINEYDHWCVSMDGGTTFEELLTSDGDAIKATGDKGETGKEGKSIRVTKNNQGFYVFESYYESAPDIIVEKMVSPISANKQNAIFSIIENTETGVITLAMADGSEFKFNLDVTYPTGIVVLTKEVFVETRGIVAVPFIVNPSDAKLSINAEAKAVELNLAARTKASYVVKPTSYDIVKIEHAQDANNEIVDGKYIAYIEDKGTENEYHDWATLVCNAKNGKGENIQISSEMFNINSVNKNSFTSFSINGHEAQYMDQSNIFVQLPGETDFSHLTANFEVPYGAKVYVNGIEQHSGKNINDFSSKVTFEVVSNTGEEKEYSVYATSIPLVVLRSPSDIKSKEFYVPESSIDVYSLDKNAENYSNVSVKGRGNTSWGMPKRSYSFKFTQETEFMGLKSHKHFCVIANYADKTLLRNATAYELGRTIYTNMKWNASTRNVHYIMNGEYKGVYMVCETVAIDKNRVDIPDLQYCTNPDEARKYGFIMEINARLDEAFNFTTTREIPFSLKRPNGRDLSTELQDSIQKRIQEAEDALFSSDYKVATSKHYYRRYFDVKSIIDWYLVNEIAKNVDGLFHSSCFMYYDPADQKFHMGPLWDFDTTFGNINYQNCNDTNDFWVKRASWIIRMFDDASFLAEVKNRWNKTKETVSHFIHTTYVQNYSALSHDAQLNFSRWDILGIYVWPNPDGYENRTTYESETTYFQNWVDERIAWLDTAINGL